MKWILCLLLCFGTGCTSRPVSHIPSVRLVAVDVKSIARVLETVDPGNTYEVDSRVDLDRVSFCYRAFRASTNQIKFDLICLLRNAGFVIEGRGSQKRIVGSSRLIVYSCEKFNAEIERELTGLEQRGIGYRYLQGRIILIK